MSPGKQKNQAPVATLPTRLLLEQQSGQLTIVEAKNAGEAYGLQAGDAIKSIDGKSVSSATALRRLLQGKQIGQRMKIVVVRDGKTVPMNRKYHGPMEIKAIQRVASKPISPVSLHPPIGASVDTTASPSQVINQMAADFGMQFVESAGRLRVMSVRPNSSSYAYGVRPGDILFQVDTQRITSLSDFQSVARTKMTGEMVNLMIVRGDNIVLVQNMKLGAKGEQVIAPVGYVATVHPFSSLKQEALERLLASPFQFTQDNAPLKSLEPPATSFVINTDDEDATTQKIATDKGDVLADAATQLDSLIDDAVESVEEITRFRTSSAPTFEDAVVEVDSKAITTVDEKDPVRVADVTNRLRKPSAKPRFNISGVRMPEIANEGVLKTVEEVARDFVEEGSEIASVVDAPLETPTLETPDLETPTFAVPPIQEIAEIVTGNAVKSEVPEDVVTTLPAAETTVPDVATVDPKDVVDDRFSDLTNDDWSSSRRHRGATEYMAGSEPNRFIDRGTTLKIASEPGQTKIINRIRVQAEEASETPPATPKPAVPAEATAQTEAAATAGSAESVVTSSTEVMSDTPAATGSEVNFADSGAVVGVTPMASEMCQQPGLAMAPSCNQCSDWGCSSCRWQGHGGFSLDKLLYGNAEPMVSFGGWLSLGYHSQSNDLFNDRPDSINLHQGWLYAEKTATAERPFGFRADVVYGIDGADTQAFGNSLGTWDFDNGFDFGAYSWAIPQLYVEMMVRDWSIKAGHFFTIAGYETVTAPDNFFYSHAMTMYNSEPFTHTGILASKAVTDKFEVYAGWTLGWDTGFNQLNGGSSWLGGFNYSPIDDISFTYVSTAGNIGSRGDDAYSHSMVLDLAVTNSLTYVVQSDLLRVDATGEDNFGINQYLLYNVNDKVGVGARLEWWKGDVLSFYAPHGGVLPANGSLSYYAATFGVNYRPRANVITRPEIRYDWSPAADYDEVYIGIDAILSF